MTDCATPARPGETLLHFDGRQADDARLTFIGRVRTPWTQRSDCPKNLRVARERMEGASIEMDPAFRPALASLETGQWVFLLTWLHEARRDLATQMPRHATQATGTFALRSPVRPNPIGLHLVRLVAIDAAAGLLRIDAADVLDGTPLLDIKPYFASVDQPPEA